MRNNKGPSVETWGTPQVMFNLDDSNPFMETNCFLLLKKDLIKCKDLPLKPYKLVSCKEFGDLHCQMLFANLWRLQQPCNLYPYMI